MNQFVENVIFFFFGGYESVLSCVQVILLHAYKFGHRCYFVFW